MKNLIAAIRKMLGSGEDISNPGASVLDYDRLVMLDAEALAEGGIGNAYVQLKPLLELYVEFPAEIAEALDSNLPGCSVTCAGVTYTIYSPAFPDPEDGGWGRAAHAFFALINFQLEGSAIRFYAINGDNDLGGMFLTGRQVMAARKSLDNRTDWPHLPTLKHPWYGKYHE